MAEPKTRPTGASVDAFLDGVADPKRREDARAVAALMEEVVGEPPQMWGSSIVGFGTTQLRYESGRELDWPLVGFSPRAKQLVVYIMPGFSEYEALLARLGKHKVGKSCLYLNKLADVDLGVLRELVSRSVDAVRAEHG